MAKRLVQTSGAVTKAPKPIPMGDKAALLERFKDYPALAVIERRFSDPNDPGSLPILLKDEDADACVNTDHQQRLLSNATVCPKCKKPVRVWLVRWINTSIEGRWGQIRSKGYVQVLVSELKDVQDISDLVERKEGDGQTYVRRGDRGQEVLCKMPLALYTYLKRAQRETQKARNNSKAAMRADLAEQAGAELGDEAGQTIHDGGIKIESMTRSTRSLEAELADDLIDA